MEGVGRAGGAIEAAAAGGVVWIQIGSEVQFAALAAITASGAGFHVELE